MTNTDKDIFQWQSPANMFKRVLSEMPAPPELWEEKYKKIREGWIMAVFAIGYELLKDGSVQVQMTDDEPAGCRFSSYWVHDFQSPIVNP